mmetsp:Transcript_11042/g.20804  ORF Transcript_11042/g.20804 Transcript_11042/m.20804 type:complete len:219 (-) Transcript_11042:551-1207(-)
MPHLLFGKYIPPLLGREDFVIIIVCMREEHLHLLPVSLLFRFDGPEHDLVILLGHLEGLLHKDTVDDGHARKTKNDLVEQTEYHEPRAHFFLKQPCNGWPVAQGYLKHGEHAPREVSEVLENVAAIGQVKCIIFEEEEQNLAEQQGKGHLNQNQEDSHPDKGVDASVDGCRHDSQGIETLYRSGKLHQANQPGQSQQSQQGGVERQVLQRSVSDPQPN